MWLEVLKAFALGILVALPVGPVLFLVIQRTLGEGRKEGMYTGLGSAVADTLYAAVGLFTLCLVRDFVDTHSGAVMIAGGILVSSIGVAIALKRQEECADAGSSALSGTKYALQSFLSALSNPAALAVMMTMLALFGLEASSLKTPVAVVLLAVACGELSYWAVVTYVLKKTVRLSGRTLNIVSRVMGCAIIVFGLVLMVKGILK